MLVMELPPLGIGAVASDLGTWRLGGSVVLVSGEGGGGI